LIAVGYGNGSTTISALQGSNLAGTVILSLPVRSHITNKNQANCLARLFLKIGSATIIWVIGGVFANPQSADFGALGRFLGTNQGNSQDILNCDSQ